MIAFSFASAPPFVKNDIVRSPGVTSASSLPRRERDSVAIGGPIVGWLGGWPISIVSLVLGLVALLVFRRGLPHVGWIVGYLLLLWLLFVLITFALGGLWHGANWTSQAGGGVE